MIRGCPPGQGVGARVATLVAGPVGLRYDPTGRVTVVPATYGMPRKRGPRTGYEGLPRARS
jgi:hypothetical protein